METNLNDPKRTDEKKKEPLKRKFNTLAVVTFAIALLAGYIATNALSSNPNRSFTFQTAQEELLHVRTEKDKIIIEELKGKIIFLKVFGWDCQYCQKEIPELIKLKKKFKNAFDTIAIEYQEHDNSFNKREIEKHNINYSVIEGSRQEQFLQYLKDEYKWDGVIPLTVVINADGKILAFEVGYKSYSLTTLLQTTLKQITTIASEKK